MRLFVLLDLEAALQYPANRTAPNFFGKDCPVQQFQNINQLNLPCRPTLWGTANDNSTQGRKSRGGWGGCIPPIIFEGGMHPQSSPPIIYRSSPPIIYRTLQNCFSHPAKIVKLCQRKIMTEKSESISINTLFFFFGEHLIFGKKTSEFPILAEECD